MDDMVRILLATLFMLAAVAPSSARTLDKSPPSVKHEIS
jgi:hypothetical protein